MFFSELVLVVDIVLVVLGSGVDVVGIEVIDGTGLELVSIVEKAGSHVIRSHNGNGSQPVFQCVKVFETMTYVVVVVMLGSCQFTKA